MRWMYPFEIHIKSLKIMPDKVLPFCFMYYEGMQTKFNHVGRNEVSVLPKGNFMCSRHNAYRCPLRSLLNFVKRPKNHCIGLY